MLRLIADPSSKDGKGRSAASLDHLLKRSDLGFWQLPKRDDNWQISHDIASQLKSKFKRLVVLGMGGSALGGKALVEGLGDTAKVKFIYNSDPHSFWKFVKEDWSPEGDAWLVISKSGGTIETLCMANALVEEMGHRKLKLKESIFVVTEETNNSLHEWALKNDIQVIPHPEDVGGRFSALCPVGLIPAAFSGVNLNELRDGALWSLKNTELIADFSGMIMDHFDRGESITVFWSYVDRLNSLLPWLEQLWAESLGKNEDILVSSPILSYGTAYQHSVLQQFMEGSKDKFFVFFRSDDSKSYGPRLEGIQFKGWDWIKGKSLGEIFDAEVQATENALRENGRRTSVLATETVDTRIFGAWIMFFELVVASVGLAAGINPFDQPGVERGKQIAKDLLNQ